MQVKELIKILKKFNPEAKADVIYLHPEPTRGLLEFYDITKIKVIDEGSIGIYLKFHKWSKKQNKEETPK